MKLSRNFNNVLQLIRQSRRQKLAIQPNNLCSLILSVNMIGPGSRANVLCRPKIAENYPYFSCNVTLMDLNY